MSKNKLPYIFVQIIEMTTRSGHFPFVFYNGKMALDSSLFDTFDQNVVVIVFGQKYYLTM